VEVELVFFTQNVTFDFSKGRNLSSSILMAHHKNVIAILMKL